MDQSISSSLAKCRQGDLGAFGHIFDVYTSQIYRYLYVRTRHRQTAEDITTVTFLKALEAIDTFDSAKGEFTSWLYRIARNSLFDHFRTTHSSADLEEVGKLDSGHNIERQTDVKISLEEVYKAVNQLPDPAREIVLLRLWDDLSYQTIAELIGKSEDATKMTFSRALRKLRLDLSSTKHVVVALIISIVYGFRA